MHYTRPPRPLRLLAGSLFLLWAGVAAAESSDDILDGLSPRPTQAPADKDKAASDSAASGGKADESIDAAPDVGTAKVKTDSEKDAAKEAIQKAPAALDRIKAVPKKRMLKRGRLELVPYAGASLNDAYYQHLSAGASLIYYLHDAFGLGVSADFMYLHARTHNLDVVRQTFTSVPAVFELPRLLTHIDAYWVPIYGKVSLFDSKIIHFDLYTTFGLGLAFAGDRHPPAANVGVGQRFVLGDWLALHFEVRDHLFIDTQEVDQIPRSDIQSYVMFTAGLSLFVPPSFEYSY